MSEAVSKSAPGRDYSMFDAEISGAVLNLSLLRRLLGWMKPYRITFGISAVLILVTIIGSAMYLVEGEENGYRNIPVSIYWAIVTMTTVGYGDLAPQTALGKLLAAGVMVLGYGIIAVPTGIVTAEIVESVSHNRRITTRSCVACLSEGHDYHAKYCQDCGERLPPLTPPEV